MRVAFVGLLMLVLAGCGGSDDKKDAGAKGGVPIDPWPALKGFPDDVPMYPTKTAQGATPTANADRFYFSVKASKEEAISFYEAGLKQKGWQVGPRDTLGDTLMIQATKAGRECHVIADGKRIEIVLPKKG